MTHAHPYAAMVDGRPIAWFSNPHAAEATARHEARFIPGLLVERVQRASWAVVDERSGVRLEWGTGSQLERFSDVEAGNWKNH